MGPGRAIAAVGRHGLGAPEGPVEVSGAEWPELRGQLGEERLTGVAAAMAAQGHLRLEADDLAELGRLDARWSERRRRSEALVADVARVLAAAEVPLRVLKGPALAALDWREGGLRRWVDVDVLVPGDRIEDCVALLTATGATRQRSELRPGWDRRFAKSVTMRSAGGIEVDVHRALVLGPHTFVIPAADLWEAPRRFTVGGSELSTMSKEATLVHTCLHATITGARRLGSLRDVLEAFSGADPGRAAALAARWRAGPTVRQAGEAVRTRLGLASHPFVAWATTLPVPTRDRRLAQVYAGERRTNRNLALRSVPHVPGLRAKASYSWALWNVARSDPGPQVDA